MYEVVNYFTDLQDGEHPYNVGDAFPRKGLKVSDERIRELSTEGNAQHRPLIKKKEGAEDGNSNSTKPAKSRPRNKK